MSPKMAPEKDPTLCEAGGRGLILPFGGDVEQGWPQVLWGVFYIVGLGWCFMGVALIADVFMGAIERITSKKTRKLNSETGRYVTVLVWNPTVANLTLMALGSSAPEILLSIIELGFAGCFSGPLGPSTIVGSAAFNLLCITAVCVSAIPDKEVRAIREMPVYVLTASASMFAYLWLLFILLGVSKNVVEAWEGILTFLFFPALVFLAFLADRGYFSKVPKMSPGRIVSAGMSKEELAALSFEVRRKHGSTLTDDQVAKFIACEHEAPRSRATYRVAATRNLTGGRRVALNSMSSGTKQSLCSVVPYDDADAELGKPAEETDGTEGSDMVFFEFEANKYAVLEDVGDMQLLIRRKGNIAAHASVGIRTRDGTAKSNADYKPVDTRLDFPPGITTQTLTVSIIDDSANEDDEEFYLDLYDVKVTDGVGTLGEIKSTTVVIIDDDLPGMLEFQDDDTKTVIEEVKDRTVDVIVQRCGGSTGKVGCKYHTEEGKAVAGADFHPVEGTLEFEHGQMTASIKVTIKAAGRYESVEDFRIILTEPFGGARFDPKTDGGADATILTVVVKSEQHTKDRVDKVFSLLQVNWDRAKVGHANWRDQFVGALYVNGGDDDENAAITVWDRCMHAVLLPWKLLFAIVPPTDYVDGWMCFSSALIMIGFMTAIITDMAGLLGCVLKLPGEITAITFVAMGTSLPDTFASKTAAVQDPSADASIGNVVGSNSVNVFLGLGLPWMMASIYWQAKGPNAEWLIRYGSKPYAQDWLAGAFIVEAGSLAFSVIVFTACAVVCIAILYARRRLCDGELGGPRTSKYATSAVLVTLWLFYVTLSSWYVLTREEG